MVLGKIFFALLFIIFDVFLFIKGAEQRRQIGMDNDEELLQFAVRQSLLDSGGAEEDQVDIWEALQVQRPNTPNDVYFDPADEELQRYKNSCINCIDYSQHKCV